MKNADGRAKRAAIGVPAQGHRGPVACHCSLTPQDLARWRVDLHQDAFVDRGRLRAASKSSARHRFAVDVQDPASLRAGPLHGPLSCSHTGDQHARLPLEPRTAGFFVTWDHSGPDPCTRRSRHRPCRRRPACVRGRPATPWEVRRRRLASSACRRGFDTHLFAWSRVRSVRPPLADPCRILHLAVTNAVTQPSPHTRRPGWRTTGNTSPMIAPFRSAQLPTPARSGVSRPICTPRYARLHRAPGLHKLLRRDPLGLS